MTMSGEVSEYILPDCTAGDEGIALRTKATMREIDLADVRQDTKSSKLSQEPIKPSRLGVP